MLLKNDIVTIKNLLKQESVLTSKEERYCYSTDASNMDEEGIIPDLVVFVESVEDVLKVVRYASANEIPIIARGAGTNMVGACVCKEGGIVLNFSRMNKILELNTSNMTVRVQPGVVLGDLKSYVEEYGLFYPPDPSNYKVSTIGGSIAQSSGGAMSFKYGTTKDYVLSLKVVTAAGQLMTLGAETIKDASGFHLNQLIIGSEGTLAIVVEAVLKLIPKPETRRVIAAYFKSVDDAVTAVDGIIADRIFPSTIDYMDNNSINTVEEFIPCNLNTTADSMLLIEIDGLNSSMQEQQNRVIQALNRSGAFDIRTALSENECENIWAGRRASFAAAARLAPDVVTDDIIVPRQNLSLMINKCRELSLKYNLKMCLVGHIGDGNLHPQIALDLQQESQFRNYINAKSEMYIAVKKLGGTISAEHGIGIEKLKYLENAIDKDAVEYMKMIKRVFDPKNILNPGKIFVL